MKALCLLFHSDYLVEIVKKKVKDGKIIIGNKEFNVDRAIPFYVKTWLGVLPMYMLKWDSQEVMEPKDFKVYETPVTPEMLKRSVELKIFHFLLRRIAGYEMRPAIWQFILATLLGMFAMYILIAARVIVI